MKAMICSDFITMKRVLVQFALIGLLVTVFIGVCGASVLVGLAALVAMVPFMYVFSVAAYDEMGGWERFRLTLPISRHQVVFGRYAGILVVMVASWAVATLLGFVASSALSAMDGIEQAAVLANGYNPVEGSGHLMLVSSMMLLVAALTLPLFTRFGMTKATRIAPVAFVLIMALLLAFSDSLSGMLAAAMPWISPLVQAGQANPFAALGLGGTVFGAVLVLYVASAFLSARLYEKRQF